jgi:hypothetical protein
VSKGKAIPNRLRARIVEWSEDASHEVFSACSGARIVCPRTNVSTMRSVHHSDDTRNTLVWWLCRCAGFGPGIVEQRACEREIADESGSSAIRRGDDRKKLRKRSVLCALTSMC